MLAQSKTVIFHKTVAIVILVGFTVREETITQHMQLFEDLQYSISEQSL